MDDDYEHVLLVKPDVDIFKVPPRSFNRSHRASDWSLDQPDWNGRLRLIVKGEKCILRIETKTGELFAQSIIDKFPGKAIENVSDSSRYFVVKVVNDLDGRSAFLGLGFTDRGDSFDLNVALQDHFKRVNQEKLIKNENLNTEKRNEPKMDLSLKDGQMIKVNLNLGKKVNTRNKIKSSVTSGTAVGFLPPPPNNLKNSSKKLNNADKTIASSIKNFEGKTNNILDFSNLSSNESNNKNKSLEQNKLKSNLDLLMELDSLNIQSTSTLSCLVEEQKGDTNENFGEFESYKSSKTSNNDNLNWENF